MGNPPHWNILHKKQNWIWCKIKATLSQQTFQSYWMFKSILPYMLQHQLISCHPIFSDINQWKSDTNVTYYLSCSYSEKWKSDANVTYHYVFVCFFCFFRSLIPNVIYSHLFSYFLCIYYSAFDSVIFNAIISHFFVFLWVHCCDVSPLSIIFIWYLISELFFVAACPPPHLLPPLGPRPPHPQLYVLFAYFYFQYLVITSG